MFFFYARSKKIKNLSLNFGHNIQRTWCIKIVLELEGEIVNVVIHIRFIT